MEDFSFLSFEGLNELQVTDLKDLLNYGNPADKVEFPWSNNYAEDTDSIKGDGSSWNVHAPVFESAVLKASTVPYDAHTLKESYSSVPFKNPELLKRINAPTPLSESLTNHNGPLISSVSDNKLLLSSTHNEDTSQFSLITHMDYILPSNNQNILNIRTDLPSNGQNIYVKTDARPSEAAGRNFNTSQNSQNSFVQKTSQIRLNPTASSFIPQRSHLPLSNGIKSEQSIPLTVTTASLSATASPPVFQNTQNQKTVTHSEVISNGEIDYTSECENESSVAKTYTGVDHVEDTTQTSQPELKKSDITEKDSSKDIIVPAPRSWADVLKAGSSVNTPNKTNSSKTVESVIDKNCVTKVIEGETSKSLISEDKLALSLGRHLFDLKLDFRPVFLQPRGLINSRNWCYINATLQALLACPPFYTLLRNLPIGIAVDRGKSSTPVIDSMVKLAYEFQSFSTFQEDLQPGAPFQPKHFYEMLGDLKSDCLKGQQEDAEEFLSYILNGMHEEMVALIKNYEREHHLSAAQDANLNGCADASDGEDDWQVIGTKQKGMVTRKVVEHKTPVSDLLGGQIRSVLSISGSKPSASVQPFFTLQLDIQSENVTSVMEALDQMTVRELIQGYTCAKTKQEVEAYSRVALQKLPPILILHLKRFVYNKNGGCKKVVKKTEYPIKLEFKKDLFTPDVKRTHRMHHYTLFAVMYHDGEEAVKGHYISDVYNHTLKSWIRCDDRAITNVTEDQVLSHSPPRVPYLLFYQVSDISNSSS